MSLVAMLGLSFFWILRAPCGWSWGGFFMFWTLPFFFHFSLSLLYLLGCWEDIPEMYGSKRCVGSRDDGALKIAVSTFAKGGAIR